MLALALILAASPNIAQLDAQEALNDALEARFDGLCKALKASGGRAPKTHVDPPSLVEPKLLRLVRTCSFRALALLGPARQKTARILWEFDGLTTEGERVTERGEADATLTLKPSGWTFTRFDDARREVVRRPAARFTDVAAESGLQFSTARAAA